MKIVRFDYERRYRRYGILIETRWFLLRFYPPVWPSWTLWWKRRHFRTQSLCALFRFWLRHGK